MLPQRDRPTLPATYRTLSLDPVLPDVSTLLLARLLSDSSTEGLLVLVRFPEQRTQMGLQNRLSYCEHSLASEGASSIRLHLYSVRAQATDFTSTLVASLIAFVPFFQETFNLGEIKSERFANLIVDLIDLCKIRSVE